MLLTSICLHVEIAGLRIPKVGTTSGFLRAAAFIGSMEKRE
jgi:hypothetical protein